MDVKESGAVRLLLRERSRRVLAAFLSGEKTVARAAREVGLDLRVVHRDVLALLGAGLLTLTRQEPRKGRAVKYYRASSEAFFVPFSATEAADLAELHGRGNAETHALFTRAVEREFARALHAEGREWGLRLYATPGKPGYHFQEGDRNAPRIDELQQWHGPAALILSGTPLLYLTAGEARELQEDLIALMRKYHARGERRVIQGRPFLLRVGFAPLTEEEAVRLYR